MKPAGRLPWLSFLLAAAACAVALGGARAASLLAWDRQAFDRGEWWRVFSGHWVHFGPLHLLPDLVVFLWAGWQLERASRTWFGISLAVLCVLVGLGLLLADPALSVYGGLSGLDHGLLVLLGFAWWRTGAKPFAGILWSLLALKLGLEFNGLLLTPVSFSVSGVRPVPWAHLLGSLGALALACVRAVLPATLDRGGTHG